MPLCAPTPDPNKVLRAVVKVIETTFDRSRWLELGLLTDSLDRVKGHRRLLRSLEWGDDDYLGCVIEMAPIVLGRQTRSPVGIRGQQAADVFPKLGVVEDYLNLQTWLQDNDSELYADLYAGEGHVALDELQTAAAELGVPDVDEHARRHQAGWSGGQWPAASVVQYHYGTIERANRIALRRPD
ncbi:MAG TPA: hypothetical protein VK790_08525 [Solirubrobacteraceae bacterium]|jgi:hypothetical protein|nr:hypothetical protein [Solirubrobacteraceae bacterium]